jgi:hypothetical protein
VGSITGGVAGEQGKLEPMENDDVDEEANTGSAEADSRCENLSALRLVRGAKSFGEGLKGAKKSFDIDFVMPAKTEVSQNSFNPACNARLVGNLPHKTRLKLHFELGLDGLSFVKVPE